MTEISFGIIIIIEIVTALFTLHIFLIFILSRKKQKSNQLERNITLDFGIIIPAYKEGEVLLNNIESLLRQNYPADKYQIYLIADQCDENILRKIIFEQVKIVKANFQVSSKINSIKLALENIKDAHQYLVILDADNVCHLDFLKNLSSAINSNSVVVQGKRKAKNLTSIFSKLDYLTDIFYNFIDRQCLKELGLSCTLSGTAFAMRRDIAENFLKQINVFGGFDKVLQSRLILNDYKIDYEPSAIVYDEKISSSEAFVSQRARWLHSYFMNMKNYSLKILKKGLKNKNLNALNYFFLTIRPPIAILSSLILMFIVIDLFAKSFFGVWFWIFSAIILFLIILYSIKLEKVNYSIISMLFFLPLIPVKQVFSLFKLRLARKTFIHTEHKHSISIDELMQRESNE
ncbi:MAG: glycosyltransferase family 2 protein [Ignavibacteria bacterium]|nr:glycosyltransferase family 2 protein [Ignavibacteria bacterium]